MSESEYRKLRALRDLARTKNLRITQNTNGLFLVYRLHDIGVTFLGKRVSIESLERFVKGLM